MKAHLTLEKNVATGTSLGLYALHILTTRCYSLSYWCCSTALGFSCS